MIVWDDKTKAVGAAQKLPPSWTVIIEQVRRGLLSAGYAIKVATPRGVGYLQTDGSIATS